MTIDRLIIGILVALTVVNTAGIMYIIHLMTDTSTTWGFSGDYGDDDDDEDPVDQPWSPKNRINSN